MFALLGAVKTMTALPSWYQPGRFKMLFKLPIKPGLSVVSMEEYGDLPTFKSPVVSLGTWKCVLDGQPVTGSSISALHVSSTTPTTIYAYVVDVLLASKDLIGTWMIGVEHGIHRPG
jgi:hypothetical protein